MRFSSLIFTALLAPQVGFCKGEQRTYIKSDHPVTCAVSYSGNLVALELHAGEECDVELWTGFEPEWCLVGGERRTEGWSAQRETVLLHASAGSTLFEFGIGRQPLRHVQRIVPIKVDGKRRGSLRVTFEPRRLEGRGDVRAALGLYEVTLVLNTRSAGVLPSPRLRVGPARLSEWEQVLARTGRPGLQPESGVVVNGKVGLHLTWRRDFTELPVREVRLDTIVEATALQAADPPDLDAEGAIAIEAEDFAREGGGGPVEISEGEHADQHGGASIYSFGPGQSHWLEWEFEVVERGKYDLFARTATQEEYSLRELTVDRDPPYPGAALLSFPGTGGWAREDPGQWVWTQLAGAENRPPLDLDAGEHKLRLTSMGDNHLNVDVMVLVPVR